MLTVVSTATCPWCSKVKEHLTLHQIPFVEWVPERKELIDLLVAHGVMTVPQVFQHDPRGEFNPLGRIGGYEDTVRWVEAQYQ